MNSKKKKKKRLEKGLEKLTSLIAKGMGTDKPNDDDRARNRFAEAKDSAFTMLRGTRAMLDSGFISDSQRLGKDEIEESGVEEEIRYQIGKER